MVIVSSFKLKERTNCEKDTHCSTLSIRQDSEDLCPRWTLSIIQEDRNNADAQ